MRLIVAVLHLHDMRPHDELVQKSVILLVDHFVLNRNKNVLQIHNRILHQK